MKLRKGTFLVVLTEEQAKALKMFIGPISADKANDIYKVFGGQPAVFAALNKKSDFLFQIFEQVKNA